MRVLVTGGSGFIGTNLIESLLKDEITVLNLDTSPPVNADHAPYWKQLNILNEPALEEFATEFKPDMIIHLAAVTDLDGTTLEYYAANIEGTQNLINVAAKLPQLKKVIFTSSMYVCKPGNVPSDYKTYTPHTLYGESKVEGEKLVKKIQNPHYKWVIVRPTSIWGPWFNVPYIDFFNVVYTGKYFDFGKACTKTYGYIGNTIFQIRQLMDAENIHGKTFYLGDKQPIPISIWANEISIKMGKGPIKTLPFLAIKTAAAVGDLLSKLGIRFPMTSFRLNNMMTNNIFPLTDLYSITGDTPYMRGAGIDETLKWMVDYKGYQIKFNKA